jgi:excisionase family DNA binding protein
MADHWVTVDEAAKLSGYHAERIRELIRDGKIKATKKGNSWWVDSKSVDPRSEYAENQGQTFRTQELTTSASYGIIRL